MKVVIGIDDPDGLNNFLNATKDCQKKFVSRSQTNPDEDDDEPKFNTKAYATSRHTVYVGEGILGLMAFEDQVVDHEGHPKVVDVFKNAGFVYVKKIVED